MRKRERQFSAREARPAHSAGTPSKPCTYGEKLGVNFYEVHLRARPDSSSTVGDAKFPQLVDSTRGDAFQRKILVSRIICK